MYARLCYLYHLYTWLYVYIHACLSVSICQWKNALLGRLNTIRDTWAMGGQDSAGKDVREKRAPVNCPSKHVQIQLLSVQRSNSGSLTWSYILWDIQPHPGQVRELPTAIRTFSFNKPNNEDTKCQHSHLNIIFAKTMEIAQQTANMPPIWKIWQSQEVRPRASKNARSGKHFMPGLRHPGHRWPSMDIYRHLPWLQPGWHPGVPSHARLNIKAVKK